MGNLLSGLGLGGCNDDNWIWIIIIIVLLLFCTGNNGLGGIFGGNNGCNPEGEQQNDWIWIIIVIAILFLCNGTNNNECARPC